MYHVFENTLLALCSVALAILTILVIFNGYLIKRNGFYVRVNCWFCNTWSKVPYSYKNSFECPNCTQYNGFDADGGYNKEIKEQHIVPQDCKVTSTPENGRKANNGLCSFCNNNLRLKVRLLANFTPLIEKNYDVEVEHFEKQLDQTYKLCSSCNKAVHTTIEQQNSWLVGYRLKYLRLKRMTLLDLKKTTENITGQQQFVVNIVKFILLIISLIILLNIIVKKIKYPTEDIKKVIPNEFMPYMTTLMDAFNSIVNTTKEELKGIKGLRYYIPHDPKIDSKFMLCGLLLQVVLTFCEDDFTTRKLSKIICWAILSFTSTINFRKNVLVYIYLLEMFCCLFLLYGYLSKNRRKLKLVKKSVKSTKRSKQRKIKVEQDEDYYSDFSDVGKEEYEEDNLSKKYTTCSEHCCKSNSSLDLNNSSFKNHNTSLHNFTFQNAMDTAKKRLNHSFLSTSTAINQQPFSKNLFKDNINMELNRSFDNLHLSNSSFKLRNCVSPVYSVNSVSSGRRPILDPPKLNSSVQNPWVAGGFWKNADVLTEPVPNLSRSSSESSGFLSQTHNGNTVYSSLPTSPNNSVCDENETASQLLETTYNYKPIYKNLASSQFSNPMMCSFDAANALPDNSCSTLLYYKSNNTFYPVLNANNMLYLHRNLNVTCNLDMQKNNLTSYRDNRKMESNVKRPHSMLFKNLTNSKNDAQGAPLFAMNVK